MNPALRRLARENMRRTIYAIKYVLWSVLYWPWVLQSLGGRRVTVDNGRRLTVLIPAYSPARMRDITPLVRSLLKCTFVEKIIVSNHNPAVSIRDFVRVQDRRLTLLDQTVRRGPGYCWMLAAREDAEYFMRIDDDVLLFPRQAALLFRRLVEQPSVPHGLSGRIGSRYVQCRETDVDGLFSLYAATHTHVDRYLDYADRMVTAGLLTVDDVELWGEDIVLSRTGSGKPRLHDAGFLLQGLTCWHSRVALHKQPGFPQRRLQVENALEATLSEPI